jgi:RNA polymerase sigma factor (sigma-70 family)
VDPAETQRRRQADVDDDLDEERLVGQAQSGMTEALRPILARYADPLYAAVILPRLGSSAAAEDVLRETFATAIEKIGSFHWEGKGIYGWLRQIAQNKIVDLHRRTQRTGRVLRALADEPSDGPTAADEALIAEEERRRARALIDEVLMLLPARYRTAVRLRLVEERSREACADALGVTVGTFDVLFFRAVRAFRKRYLDLGGAS